MPLLKKWHDTILLLASFFCSELDEVGRLRLEDSLVQELCMVRGLQNLACHLVGISHLVGSVG